MNSRQMGCETQYFCSDIRIDQEMYASKRRANRYVTSKSDLRQAIGK